MSERSEEQQAAVRRFETDYLPNLEKGIVSKDITQAMRHDLAIILAPPEIPLAVAVSGPSLAKTEPERVFVSAEYWQTMCDLIESGKLDGRLGESKEGGGTYMHLDVAGKRYFAHRVEEPAADVPLTEDVMTKLARDFSEPTAHGIDAPPKVGKGRRHA